MPSIESNRKNTLTAALDIEDHPLGDVCEAYGMIAACYEGKVAGLLSSDLLVLSRLSLNCFSDFNELESRYNRANRSLNRWVSEEFQYFALLVPGERYTLCFEVLIGVYPCVAY